MRIGLPGTMPNCLAWIDVRQVFRSIGLWSRRRPRHTTPPENHRAGTVVFEVLGSLECLYSVGMSITCPANDPDFLRTERDSTSHRTPGSCPRRARLQPEKRLQIPARVDPAGGLFTDPRRAPCRSPP